MYTELYASTVYISLRQHMSDAGIHCLHLKKVLSLPEEYCKEMTA